MILITGINGFIGSKIARLLLERGEKVRGTVRKTSNLSNLKGLEQKLELIDCDIRDKQPLDKAFRGISACFHTAALVKSGHFPREDFFSTNLAGTMNVCDAAMKAGVMSFVHTSSCETLRQAGGSAGGKCGTLITEDAKNDYSGMVGDYGRSKFLAEQHVRACCSRGLPAIIVNPTGVAGPEDANLTPPNALLAAFSKGWLPFYFETGFNVVDVRDVAKGHILAMEKGCAGSNYVLGGTNVRLSELFSAINGVTGKRKMHFKLPYMLVAAGMRLLPIDRNWSEKVRASRRPFFFDSGKAARELGWKPGFDLQTTLKDALSWHDSRI